MGRTLTLAGNQALFVSSTSSGAAPASSMYELYNVQSFTWDVNQNLEPISVFGQRAAVQRDSLTSPEITFSFDYYITDYTNERNIGLTVLPTSGNPGLSGVLTKIFDGSEDEKNYFLTVAGQAQDAIGSNPGNNPCIGFGNANLTSYSFTAQVGSYPTVSVAFAALNARGYTDSVSETIPAIDSTTGLEFTGVLFSLPIASGNARYGRDAIIRPGDVIVDFSNVSGLFYSLSGNCVSSVNLSFDLGREPLECLGNRYAKARSLANNIDLTTSITFQAPDLVQGSVAQYFCGTGLYNATIQLRRPSCTNNGALALKYDIRGMRLNHEGGVIGLDNAGTEITMDFVSSLGSASDNINQLYLSGTYVG